jgi:7,8-dihydro-6-hydroxymethylpterin-pyrophosphokinase
MKASCFTLLTLTGDWATSTATANQSKPSDETQRFVMSAMKKKKNLSARMFSREMSHHERREKEQRDNRRRQQLKVDVLVCDHVIVASMRSYISFDRVQAKYVCLAFQHLACYTNNQARYDLHTIALRSWL